MSICFRFLLQYNEFPPKLSNFTHLFIYLFILLFFKVATIYLAVLGLSFGTWELCCGVWSR